MSFRPALTVTLLGVAGLLPAGAEEPAAGSFAPEMKPVETYAVIWERSPFIVETKAVAESAGLARKYTLTGLARVGGEDVAFLRDQTMRSIMISGSNPKDGLELVSVSIDQLSKNSTATIRQGEEQASLSITQNSAAGGAVPPPAPAAAVPAVPAAPPPTQANHPSASPSAPPAPVRRIIRPPINVQP